MFDTDYVAEHLTHGYATTVHSAQGVTADATHAVLGDTTTRSMLYVAMTRARDANTAYLYERTTEQEYGPISVDGPHVMERGTSQQAGQLAGAIIASHDHYPSPPTRSPPTHHTSSYPNGWGIFSTDDVPQSVTGRPPTASGSRPSTDGVRDGPSSRTGAVPRRHQKSRP